jgi:TolA-binding protein
MQTRQRMTWRCRAAAILLLSSLALMGCAASQSASGTPKDDLNSGYEALAQKQYDKARNTADAFLTRYPEGPGRAEAYYLRGRAIYDRLSDSGSSSTNSADLQEARTAYIRALEASPSPALDAHIRADLGNVAFFQDDYVTALQQTTAAYEKLDKPEDKADALYRVGRCQQRLGHFEEADHTFASVQQQFPATRAATDAKRRQGARGFWVQLATYRQPAEADRATGTLRQQGITPQTSKTPTGQTVVRVPAKSLAEARQIKSRFAGIYPDALIQP